MLPNITITDAAADALRSALNEASPGDVIHLAVSSRYDHALDIGPKTSDDPLQEVSGISLCVEAASLARADGISIDFVSTEIGGGFRIDNPNAPPKLTEVEAQELHSRLESREISVLVDVRTTWEREIARLPDSVLLDDASNAKLIALPKDTPIAFYCHHGVRSRMAASQFLELGFTRIYNLAGGIEAWSQTVDSSIPRY